ncbi:MAG: diaminopimelate epimerase [Clostridia bacterium]|nr:diaminopimelate epimerase [Clostridia bacterium]
MRFTKMQGLGNDYLYFFGEVPSDVAELTKKLSHRHFGVGSDGTVFITESDIADFGMRIFNADGSEAMMCGNGIRCVGKYVYDKGHTQKTEITVETRSGVKTLTLFPENGRVKSVRVGMGKATAEEEKCITVGTERVSFIPVDVGNPHAVIFVNDAESAPVYTLGERVCNNSFFEDGVNVEFVSLIGENRLRMRVYERGSGVTLACGTGAVASAVAAARVGKCSADSPITVVLDGGELVIELCGDGSAFMTGSAETVCDCEIKL